MFIWNECKSNTMWYFFSKVPISFVSPSPSSCHYYTVTSWIITKYIWKIQRTETREIKECIKDGSPSPAHLCLSCSFQMVLLCELWHLPRRAYDQVVALTSIRQGEIKHATVRRHTRRIKLQLLTCDIKKPASIRQINKRDTASEREGREMCRWMWCQKKLKPFSYLLTIIQDSEMAVGERGSNRKKMVTVTASSVKVTYPMSELAVTVSTYIVEDILVVGHSQPALPSGII